MGAGGGVRGSLKGVMFMSLSDFLSLFLFPLSTMTRKSVDISQFPFQGVILGRKFPR